MLGVDELLQSIIDSLTYYKEIQIQDKDALLVRLNSTTEVNRILMDPQNELNGIRVRVQGMIEEEKGVQPLDHDSAQGYQFGHIVEEILKQIESKLRPLTKDGQPYYLIQWSKSFSEGYGKIAGENHCYFFPHTHCPPVHLFVTTGVDEKKSMEKKESFMLAYYSDTERMKPVKLF
jgi:hypothetical protein